MVILKGKYPIDKLNTLPLILGSKRVVRGWSTDWHNFSVMIQIVNISVFVGQMVSATTT